MSIKERIQITLIWLAFKQRRYRQSALAKSIHREYLIPSGTQIKLTPRQRARLICAGHAAAVESLEPYDWAQHYEAPRVLVATPRDIPTWPVA